MVDEYFIEGPCLIRRKRGKRYLEIRREIMWPNTKRYVVCERYPLSIRPEHAHIFATLEEALEDFNKEAPFGF